MMKAITLWQPWAQFMALGYKTFETRGRRIKHRGEFAIHAGQHQPPLSAQLRQRMKELKMDPDEKYPKGAILGVADLFDCIPTEDARDEAEAFGELMLGNYQPHRYAYLTQSLRRLPEPVPCRGLQALPWTVPTDIEALVRRQLQMLDEPSDTPLRGVL